MNRDNTVSNDYHDERRGPPNNSNDAPGATWAPSTSSLSLSEQKRLPPDFLAHHVQQPAPGYRPSRSAVTGISTPNIQQQSRQQLSSEQQDAVALAMDSTGRVDDALVEGGAGTMTDGSSMSRNAKAGCCGSGEWSTRTKVLFLVVAVLVMAATAAGAVLAFTNSAALSSSITDEKETATTIDGPTEPSSKNALARYGFTLHDRMSNSPNLLDFTASPTAYYFDDPWTPLTTLEATEVEEHRNRTNNAFGTSLVVSKDGTTLAVHNHRIDEFGVYLGPTFTIFSAPTATTSDDNNMSGAVAGVPAWKQLGSQIIGECILPCSEDFRLTLSRNGNTLAIGGRFEMSVDNNSTDLIHVYDYNGTEWVQREMRQLEEGENATIVSVSLSADAFLLAFGIPALGIAKVMEWQSSESRWVQQGDTFLGRSLGDHLGSYIALSEDGSVLVIATADSGDRAFKNDILNDRISPSYVDTYVWRNEIAEWVELDFHLTPSFGSQVGILSATSVALSKNGNILAIGLPAKNNCLYTPTFGAVEVYARANGSTIWFPRSVSLLGLNRADWFGYSIDLSSDGMVLAVSVPKKLDFDGFNSGEVRIFYWKDPNWIQLGNALDGYRRYDGFGDSLSLSTLSDGTTLVAAGAPGYDESDKIQNSGHIRIFRHKLAG